MTKRSSILLAAVLCFSLSCKKTPQGGSTNTEVQRNYQYINETGKTVHFSLYKNAEDYRNDVNPELRIDLQPEQTYNLQLTDLRTHYVDWYTDGYDYNNWALVVADSLSFNSVMAHMLSTSSMMSVFRMNFNYIQGSTRRILLLNGNQPQTSWHAIGAYRGFSGNEIWSALSADAKDKKLVLQKDMAVSFSSKVNAQTITLNGNFFINNSGNNELSISFSFPTQVIDDLPFISIFGRIPVRYPLGSNRSADTLLLQNADTTYYMVKD